MGLCQRDQVLSHSRDEEARSRIGMPFGNVFPSSVFDIHIHLLVHLVDDIGYNGPVHYRWMYFVERFLKQLKDYVRNMALPESSIVEGHLVMRQCITSRNMSRRQIHLQND